MLQHGAPAAVVRVAGLDRVRGEDLPARVLEVNAGALSLLGEAHLEASRARVVVTGVPGHREAGRRVPGQDASPLALAAVRVPLEDPAADLLLEHDLGDRVAADRVR